jgi:hypothetical protein
MVAGLRATAKAVEHPPEPKVGAPVLDPTTARGRLIKLVGPGSTDNSCQDQGVFVRQSGTRIQRSGEPGKRIEKYR